MLATATTVCEAEILVEAGVDVIIAQGFEAGAHRGTFAVPYKLRVETKVYLLTTACNRPPITFVGLLNWIDLITRC
ncbi:hypothetical protein SAMD00079811_46520 [Scytonema sp. HK-05]|nr:hypothetical protein NIES2130_11840 [Scytonema sp. HK-05]BAY47036.1 hypothetical protein SAMD00079811_46520 [Scytonema sp. HK-05]